MQVHICTFQIKLNTVTVSPSLNMGGKSLQSVWRGQKGQVIVVGAIRSIIKNGIATFNEVFEIKTDLIRDTNNASYLPNYLILQIRPTGHSLHEKISTSTCKLNLNSIINTKETTVLELQSENKAFVNKLEVKCLQVVISGLRKSQKKLQRTLSRQKQSQSGAYQQSNRIQRSSISRSKEDKSRSRSKQIRQDNKNQYQKLQQQISKLKRQLQSEQANNIMASQQLKNTQLQLAEQEQVINQLSALISQRQTNIVELNQKLQKSQEQIQELNSLNKKLKSTAKDFNVLESKNAELQKYIVERERQIEELNIKLRQSVQKQKENKINIAKEKEINIFLSKSIDQLKKDLNRKQQQNGFLSSINKSNETEKQKFKDQLKQLKDKFSKSQVQFKADLVQSSIKFNQLYEKYFKLKQTQALLNNMVSRTQYEEMQKNYELKLKQFQERELALKQNVEAIEKEMNELQELLQDKEENQTKLIDFSRKLQLEIDSLQAQKKFWTRISQLTGQQPTQINSQAQLKRKVSKLLSILKQNSNSFLQSQKNRLELILIQKENKQMTQRISFFKDESKQIKDKYTVLLKENKKLIEKLHRLQKENEYLLKNNHKLNSQLDVALEKEKNANQEYQILNYRMNWLQKQLAHLKSVQNEQASLQEDYYNYIDRSVSGMGVIKQMSQEFVSSRPHSRKSYQHNKDQVKQFNTKALQELTSLLKQRVDLSQKLHKKIQEKVQTEYLKENNQQLQRQFTELSKLTTQLKRKLLQKGEREAAVHFELQLKKVSEQINKLQTTNL